MPEIYSYLLFKEDGNQAGLYDVCDWIIHVYPDDVFVSSPKSIVKLRELAIEILAHKSPSKP